MQKKKKKYYVRKPDTSLPQHSSHFYIICAILLLFTSYSKKREVSCISLYIRAVPSVLTIFTANLLQRLCLPLSGHFDKRIHYQRGFVCLLIPISSLLGVQMASLSDFQAFPEFFSCAETAQFDATSLAGMCHVRKCSWLLSLVNSRLPTHLKSWCSCRRATAVKLIVEILKS